MTNWLLIIKREQFSILKTFLENYGTNKKRLTQCQKNDKLTKITIISIKLFKLLNWNVSPGKILEKSLFSTSRLRITPSKIRKLYSKVFFDPRQKWKFQSCRATTPCGKLLRSLFSHLKIKIFHCGHFFRTMRISWDFSMCQHKKPTLYIFGSYKIPNMKLFIIKSQFVFSSIRIYLL